MAYPFAAAEVLTAVDLNAMIGAPTQNTQTGTTYTAVLLDAGKTVTLSNASAVTLTIPAQASVSWADNTQLNFLNIGAGTVTITPAAGVTINGTPLTLATSKGGSLVRTASNVWTFIPFSGGVEAANFTNAATGTYTTGGKDYKYVTFTGSGELVVDQAGFADILCVGGGGGGGSSGAFNTYGGAGGMIYIQNHYFQSGTFTATIGAGGTTTNNTLTDQGNTSSLDQIIAAGGGAGWSSGSGQLGIGGGSGGGTTINANYVGVGIPGMGNNGGFANPAGGGGAGGAASGSTRGAGSANSITGSSVTYSTGGDSGTPVTVNSGNGHGQGTAGDSGVIIVRVVV